MDQGDISRLFEWLNPRESPVLVQMPEGEYEQLRERWKLPRR